MNQGAKIYVAGHGGMVGSAIVRRLKLAGFQNLVLKTSKELDLRNQSNVDVFFRNEKPEYVFLSAAKVGGILANDNYRGEFIYDNLMIQNNVIHHSYLNGVKKLLFLGSSCIYPKLAPQPLKEEYLLSGFLEPTNEPYAIAKIAGIKTCEAYRSQYDCDFISVLPSNLYGPNDNYDLTSSHVLPALLRKFHEAKVQNKSFAEVWGTGKPMREFLHVDDLADACFFLMKEYSGSHPINIGTGEDISINDLAEIIKKTVEFKGEIIWDNSKPDGTPRKLLNTEKLSTLGWKYKIHLTDGIKQVYKSLGENVLKDNQH
jgi:GDP-L-fucose synthase